MSYFQQVHSQIIRILNLTVTGKLTEEWATFREQVESTFRYIYFESRYFLSQFHNKVATAFKSLTHLFHRSLRSRISSFSGFLRYRTRPWCVLPLQFVRSLYNPFRSCNETNTPACHGISLGNTVYNHCTILHFRELCNALVLTDIIDMFINFISYDNYLRMLCQHGNQSGQFLLAIYRPRRIGRRTEN